VKNREFFSKILVEARNIRDSNFEPPDFRDKGKRSISSEDLAFKHCKICPSMGFRLPLCKAWSICSNCNLKGHLAAHCKAQWKPIGKALHHHLGNWLNLNGASSSKGPQISPLVDTIPANTAQVSSFPPLCMELQLQNPSVPHSSTSTLPALQ
jgi:hypothetical protein